MSFHQNHLQGGGQHSQQVKGIHFSTSQNTALSSVNTTHIGPQGIHIQEINHSIIGHSGNSMLTFTANKLDRLEGYVQKISNQQQHHPQIGQVQPKTLNFNNQSTLAHPTSQIISGTQEYARNEKEEDEGGQKGKKSVISVQGSNINQSSSQGGVVSQTTEQHGNTITVQSTKVIGEYNYSFVSVSPTKKAMVDTPMLKKIKVIQLNEIKNWKGLQVEYISRPGLTNLYTSKKLHKTAEYFKVNINIVLQQILKLEDERFKVFLEGLIRYREWEEDRLNQAYQYTEPQAKGKEFSLRGNEFLNFKNLKDPSILLRDGPLPLSAYNKTGMIGAASTTGGFLDQTHHDLLYKLVKTDGKLIRAILENNGFLQTEAHDWNILWTCQSMKPSQYEGLNENQKINHFPQSYELTRKDRLCYNIVQMQDKFNKDDFNIIPDTYILPDEFADFYSHFHKLKSKEQSNLWIIKPQNSSQGKGIYIIDDISEVPIDESCIVSRYITNPLLINNLKFDLRIYVLITSMDPWRIYVYHEGLARFASEPYQVQSSKQNKFAHLTNYSINKKNEKFVQNANADQDDTGHKWSLAALSKHLEQIGIDLNFMWSKIYDVILKSLLSIDSIVYNNLKKLPNKNNCFELLGYDILIDSDLKPWLMEVNLSPSLATDSPLDLKIKSGLIIDTFNLVGIRKFDRRRDNLTKMKNRVKNIMRAKSYQSRQTNPQGGGQTKQMFPGAVKEEGLDDFFYKNKLLFERISQINGRHRDMIRETLQEHQRRNNFIRIYPTKNSDIYDNYFLTPRPSNKVLHRYLFSDEVIHFPPSYPGQSTQSKAMIPVVEEEDQQLDKCFGLSQNQMAQTGFPSQLGIHQTSAGEFSKIQSSNRTNSAIMKTRPSENLGSKKLLTQTQTQSLSQNQAQQQQEAQQQKEKLLITGDDVLIEYVARLMIAVKSIKEHILRPAWKNQIEKFIKHYVWHSSDVRRAENNKLWQRLESRLIEMKERRKRLLKSLYKKENPQHLNSTNGQTKQTSLTHQGIIDFEKEYELKEEQKNVIIQGFSAAQLEEMLRTSTKNVAYEVISCLIDSTGKGVLTEIIKWLTTCNQNLLNDQDSILNQLSRKKDLDESDEEPESFVYAPTGINKHEKDSSASVGTSSIGSGNSGEVRIKIRKNSMEPHSKMKANHSQLIQQKLKQKESSVSTTVVNRDKQTQNENESESNAPNLEVEKFINLNMSPGPHQKTQSTLIASSKLDTPQNDGGSFNAINKQIISNFNQVNEENKEIDKNDVSMYGSPSEISNKSFIGKQNEGDFTSTSKINSQTLGSNPFEFQNSNIGTERKRAQNSEQISLNPALSKTAVKSILTSSIQPSLESTSIKQQISATSSKEKSQNLGTNSTYFKTYSSQLKSDMQVQFSNGQGAAQRTPNQGSNMNSELNSFSASISSNLNAQQVPANLTSAYGSYYANNSSQAQVGGVSGQIAHFSQSFGLSPNATQIKNSSGSSEQPVPNSSVIKKVIKMTGATGSSSSNRKTFNSVKRQIANNFPPNSANATSSILHVASNGQAHPQSSSVISYAGSQISSTAANAHNQIGAILSTNSNIQGFRGGSTLTQGEYPASNSTTANAPIEDMKKNSTQHSSSITKANVKTNK